MINAWKSVTHVSIWMCYVTVYSFKQAALFPPEWNNQVYPPFPIVCRWLKTLSLLEMLCKSIQIRVLFAQRLFDFSYVECT